MVKRALLGKARFFVIINIAHILIKPKQKMEEYFKNKFRIPSIRLQQWNYASPAMYFVTICTKDRKCCLCEINDGWIYLTEIGKVVFKYWLEIPKHFNNVELDDWIIMPNHLHGILVLKDDKDFNKCRDTTCHVSTGRKFGYMAPKSLSSIIQAFKASVKRECNKNDLSHFQWQRNYYEHIIRDEDDYGRIKEYIALNPINWQTDRNNPSNIHNEKV